MVIAVASGKGGTGKTTIAANLAWVAEKPVQLLDCDVEEPNVHLFLNGPPENETFVTLPIPQIDAERCNGCGECSRFCSFNAIAVVKGTPLIFPELCHACGGCARVCPQGAISEKEERIGAVQERRVGGIHLVTGLLTVGLSLAPPVVRAVKARSDQDMPVVLDAPPGTGCPVVAALQGADFALLVTEPTPFGLHDLRLAVELVRKLEIPFAVVVNRVGIGDERVHRFCSDEGIPIFSEFPDDRRVAEAYSRGKLLVEALPHWRPLFVDLWKKIEAATRS